MICEVKETGEVETVQRGCRMKLHINHLFLELLARG